MDTLLIVNMMNKSIKESLLYEEEYKDIKKRFLTTTDREERVKIADEYHAIWDQEEEEMKMWLGTLKSFKGKGSENGE